MLHSTFLLKLTLFESVPDFGAVPVLCAPRSYLGTTVVHFDDFVSFPCPVFDTAPFCTFACYSRLYSTRFYDIKEKKTFLSYLIILSSCVLISQALFPSHLGLQLPTLGVRIPCRLMMYRSRYESDKIWAGS